MAKTNQASSALPPSHFNMLVVLGLILVAVVVLFFYFRSPSSSFLTMLARRNERASQAADPHQIIDFSPYFVNETVSGIPLEQVKIGELYTPSGQVVATDPWYFVEDSTQPFIQTIAPGKYKVILTIGDFGESGKRVAFARLVISDQKVKKWQLATTTLENTDDLDGIGVDAGLVALTDAETAQQFIEHQDAYEISNPEGNYFTDTLAPGFADHMDWNNYVLDSAKENNVMMFSSGIGDGFYQSYWGLDENGQPAVLVIDFQMFDERGAITEN